MVKKAGILSSTLLVQRFGTLTEYELMYTKPNGEPAEMSREVYDRGHAAGVLLHDPARDTVVLVRQFRPPPLVNGQSAYLLEVCAGILDGDDPEVCARREALEETGFEIENLRFVCQAYSNPAALTEVLHLYFADYQGSAPKQAGGGLAEEGEDIEVVEMPFGEAYSLIGSGDIVDMKTIILLQAMMLEKNWSLRPTR
jgi:GDP-mannose pyrophosphatase NudK